MKKVLALTETLAAVFLLLIALLTAGNVVMRDLFSVQIPDWFDGSKLMQGIALFWGFAVATHHGSHICVDVVWENLKPAGQRLLDLMSTLITLVFLGFMAWMVWVKVSSVGRQTTSDLQIRLDYFYAVAALGATAAVVLAALRVINLWRATSPEHPSEHQLGS
ncbi:MAG: TRAP transporter small permease [Betaproteobacteria bacterium]|nr:TRAP transporter small permease [Burkholderiales bacterium]NBT82249.1 TRAP transporter small permease [Betaproteobacteria bacterium]NBY55548.1 TRAP transporter small permease [Betaproteobacteria bacterium]